MERSPEVMFLDPGVDDAATILGNLRPEVAPILLDPGRPAARQMAEGPGDRGHLAAVDAVLHGATSRVRRGAQLPSKWRGEFWRRWHIAAGSPRPVWSPVACRERPSPCTCTSDRRNSQTRAAVVHASGSGGKI